MSEVKSYLRRILYAELHNAKKSEPQYILLGIIGFIGFGLYYFIWRDVEITQYENMPLRLIAMLLCLGLIVKNHWPKKIQSFRSIYWYLTLLYILPYFFSFMLFKNNFSQVWIINSMTQLVYLILLTDWIMTMVITIVGVTLGWISYVLTTSVYLPANLNGIIFAYLALLGVGTLINYNRQRIQDEKVDNLRALGASIAHELRTPLASLNVAIDTLNTVFPTFIDAYQKAQVAELPVKPLKADHLKQLDNKLGTMKKETRSSLTFIDMLLLNLSPKSDKSKVEAFSVKKCIRDTLERYPFVGNERELIHWNESTHDDFIIHGEPVLVIHVLFNLIKNAIYYVHKAGKGNIQLSTKREQGYNLLFVKDTGTGIARSILPHIFERFFSRTYHGAGVGLTFCRWVMNDLGGEIACESVEGDYTLFTLRFPDKELPRE